MAEISKNAFVSLSSEEQEEYISQKMQKIGLNYLMFLENLADESPYINTLKKTLSLPIRKGGKRKRFSNKTKRVKRK